MSDSEIPIRRQTARFLVGGARRGQGVLLLYPDKLAAVISRAAAWGYFVGSITLVVTAYPLVHQLGALGGFIGAGVGGWIGDAIGKSQAARKAAAHGDRVAVIPLDSITSLQTRKSTGIDGWLGVQDLLVTTVDGAEYGFRGKMDTWQADLASALTVRGSEVRAIPHGMTVTPSATREED